MRLADRHQWVDVDAMLASISARQFREWIEYQQIEPFEGQRADYRSAQLCALLFNLLRGRGKAAKRPADFMPRYGPRKRARGAQLADMLTAAAKAALNARRGSP